MGGIAAWILQQKQLFFHRNVETISLTGRAFLTVDTKEKRHITTILQVNFLPCYKL